MPQFPQGERAVGWLEAARLSGQLLGSIAAPAPFSLSAQVTGVSLALLAYDARQPAQAQAAAARPAAAGPSSSSAAPVPPIIGIGRAAGKGAGAVHRAEPPVRLRKRVRMAAGGARRGAAQPAAGGGQAACADPGPGAEHILLQQWGLSLHVRVVPPQWSEQQQAAGAAADKSRGLHNHHSHHGAEGVPVHVAEEASTPSTSDTGEGGAALLLHGYAAEHVPAEGSTVESAPTRQSHCHCAAAVLPSSSQLW